MSKPIPKSYKWELILLLWVAFFLNQGDRQIFNSVLPLIRENLGLSDLQLGLVATIFTFLYGILVPIAGFAGDVFQKRWIVMLSLATFSLGTLCTGYANGLILLIIFRSIATGAGEAFYYPAANSMIGQYHTKNRAQAMAIHQTANYTGVVVSGFLAAWIGENYGWRMAFYTFGFFGVIWVIIVFFRFRNDKADATLEKSTQETDSAVDKITLREALRATFTKPTLGLLSLAFGGMVFVHIGYVTWMPTFLYEKYDMKLSSAGLNSMLYHHLLAYVGVLLAGRISDKLTVKYRKARMWIEFIGLLLGFPFIVWMGATESLILCYVALAGFGFFRGMYDSNLFAAMFDVIDPKYRASATGIMVSCAFIVGALSPVILGWVKQNFTLGQGISALGFIYLFSAILVLIAIKWTFDRDFVGDA
jgi:MFS family permease